METFLEGVARAYLTREPKQLVDYCFVFPNKRSLTVWSDALVRQQRATGRVVLNPTTTTISELVASLTPGQPAGRMELIFRLYRVYSRVVEEAMKMFPEVSSEKLDFNSFIFWADMLLGDFNDIDMYLTPASELFVNLKRLREIATDPLTDDLAVLLGRYYDNVEQNREAQHFWLHLNYKKDSADHQTANSEEGKTPLSARFMRLWLVLDEVYRRFKDELRRDGLYYSGMSYRYVAEMLQGPDAPFGTDKLPASRYIFVGFTMLSASEKAIFRAFQDQEAPDGSGSLADFYWDDASPAFKEGSGAPSYFLRQNVKEFHSRYAAEFLPDAPAWPRIHILGIGSHSGEVKAIGDILNKYFPAPNEDENANIQKAQESEAQTAEALRHTAVVLPEESMSTQLLYSIPPHIKPLNLTMGYKLRNTPVSALISCLIGLQLRARRSSTGAYTFFHEDLRRVLTHPLVQEAEGPTANCLLSELDQRRLFNVPLELLQEPQFKALRPLLSAVMPEAQPTQVFTYLRQMLQWLEKLLNVPGDEVASQEEPSDQGQLPGEEDTLVSVPQSSDVKAARVLQWSLVMAYLQALDTLEGLQQRYAENGAEPMDPKTIFSMIERMVGGESATFEGIPLNGLQIMGVLEARSLDFTRVIIPSMNERLFPRRHFASTFIPNDLRAAYQMSTLRHQETLYSYYFYRMIARAEDVWLLYDTRTQDVRSPNMSRYINQLTRFFRPEGLEMSTESYTVDATENQPLYVEKTPEIMAEIHRYFSGRRGDPCLSASTIEMFRNCSLQFFLNKIEGYQREDDIVDYMDSSTFGTVIHAALQEIYEELRKANPVLTAKALEDMASNSHTRIEPKVTRLINQHYHHVPLEEEERLLAPLSGESEMYHKQICRNIQEVLRADAKLAPIRYLHSEWPDPDDEQGHVFHSLHLERSDNSTANPALPRSRDVNFTFRIDRIDQLSLPDGKKLTRIIDYKSGNDSPEIKGIENMFGESPRKAVRQLMLYCQAYAQHTGNLDEPIQPLLYRTGKIGSEGEIKPVALITGENRSKVVEEITDYHQLLEYQDGVLDILDELLDPEQAFVGAVYNDACRFCQFTSLCNRPSKPGKS